MQWIKTLIIFLALFLSGGASSASSQVHALVKNEQSSINADVNLLLSRTGTIKQSVLLIHPNNQVLVKHTDQMKKVGLRSKYRCGSKRFKNFRHVNSINFAFTVPQNAHRHTKYCCGKFCCGKKSWQEHHTENKSQIPDPCWVDQFQDDQSTNDGVEFSSPPPNDNFLLLPEAVSIPYHKSLSIIAPRA